MPVKSNPVAETADVWDDEGAPPTRDADGKDTPTVYETNRDMVTISLKGGSGTQAWIVLHCNSVGEAIDTLDNPEWEELVRLTASRGDELQEAHGGIKKASTSPAAGRSSSGWGGKTPKPSGGFQKRSQSSGGAVAWDAAERVYACEHGDAEERSGSKNGKDWLGYFCPNEDRNEQCQPKFKN